MTSSAGPKFLVLASFPASLLQFRGALIADMVAHGQEVHVAAPGLCNEPDLVERLRSQGVQTHDVALRRTGANPLADVRSLMQLVRLMREVKPDGFLGYTIKPVIYGTLAAWIARVPQRYALVTGLGYVFQDDGRGGLLRAIGRRLYSLALRHATKVLFQNPDDERLFRDLALIPDAVPSRVINGSGVDVTEFRPVALPTGLRFLLIARLLGAKGIREYVEAARRVRSRHPEVVFNLVGWIDDSPDAIRPEELESWVTDGAVRFLGRMEDVRPAIADSNVYVLPSYREGTPRTVLEAMAMGRPVITTDAPGCRETVVSGENGFLVPVGSIDALVEAMQRFIDDPGLIGEMGARSRELAVQKYDVRKVNEVMLLEMGIA